MASLTGDEKLGQVLPSFRPLCCRFVAYCFTAGVLISIMPASFARGYSSAGRALAWHARGPRFDPAYLHQQAERSSGSPSSRGLGHYPFTVGTGVRIPVGMPVIARVARAGRCDPSLALVLWRPAGRSIAKSLQAARVARRLDHGRGFAAAARGVLPSIATGFSRCRVGRHCCALRRDAVSSLFQRLDLPKQVRSVPCLAQPSSNRKAGAIRTFLSGTRLSYFGASAWRVRAKIGEPAPVSSA